ncbi:MAG: hypothetical protein ABIT01_00710, partial [Thermoanaerobaculia bacterium]
LAIFNALTPATDLGGDFFALHGILALPAAVVAGLASTSRGLLFRGTAHRPFLLFAVFLLSLAAHTLLAHNDYLGLARKVLIPGLLAGTVLLVTRAEVEPLVSGGMGAVWLGAGLFLGALLFGVVVWAMNLGHWYLVSKTLPFQLLCHACEAFGALAFVRALFAVLALGFIARPSFGPAGDAMAQLVDPMSDGLFFWSRVLWGLLAPVVLAPFVIRTARMKSNQAATGLLYVALVFVMIGELLATYLTLRTGLPV